MIRNHSHWIVTYDYMTGDIRQDHVFSHRFAGDKAFVDNDKELILADGVVLNSSELEVRTHTGTVQGLYELILKGSLNQAKLYGPFTAFLYDKQENEGKAFGNHTGDASVFYTINETRHIIVLSNNFNVLVSTPPTMEGSTN